MRWLPKDDGRNVELQPYDREATLRRKVVSGGFWVVALRGVQLSLYVLRLMILARFLYPYDFGLLGIALLTALAVETFSQTGFAQALVQRKGAIDTLLDPAWTFLVIRGFALFAVVFLSAPFVSELFNTPDAVPVIRVIGTTLILQGLTNIWVVMFQKDLDFRNQFIFVVGGSLLEFSVSIGIVLLWPTVWALVIGTVVGYSARLALSYILHPGRPRIVFDFGSIRELLGFGKWILASGIVTFLVTQIDSLLVGAVIGASTLGLYQMANTISNSPTTEIAHVISQVTLPAYSKLQAKIRKVRTSYLKILKATTFGSSALCAFIIGLAPEIVEVFLGGQWISMIPVMRVLALAGLARAVAATTGPVLVGLGKPRIEAFWQGVRLSTFLVMAVLLVPGWGMLGVSIAVLLGTVVSAIGFCSVTVKLIESSSREFAESVVPGLAIAASAVGTMMLGIHLLDASGLVEFIVAFGIGIGTIAAVSYAFETLTAYGILGLIAEIRRTMKDKPEKGIDQNRQ